MKQLVFSFIIVLFFGNIYSQEDCKAYLPMTQGTQWEITNFNAKGKAQGKIQYEVISIETEDNVTTFTVEHTTFDKKGEVLYTSSFTAECVDGKFQFDMAYRMDGGQMQAYQNMDVEVDATEYEIPSFSEPEGTSLTDGSLNVRVGANGAYLLNMNVLVTERKIEAYETIETAAGSFDCIVLSQKVSTKVLIRIQSTTKEWYAEGIGMVRSETYNRKGKLQGYSELTSYTKA